MKSNAKSKIIILTTLGILFILSAIISKNLNFNTGISDKSSELYDNIILDNEKLKMSKVSGKIHIDNNWSAAKIAGICTGNGTYSEPYVIEDLVIDEGGTGSGVLIENSDVYFRIENCTVYNLGNTGIRLSNVTHSQLINNNCSSNYYGIRLQNCNNNTVFGNIAYTNYFGIILGNSPNNTISGNTVILNTGVGIYLDHSDINTVSGNIANNNGEAGAGAGIYLYQSDYNNISGNTANNNDGAGTGTGIFLYQSDYNDISGNTANNNLVGIYLYQSDYNDISGNTANYNKELGIYLCLGCDNNDISGNIMNQCGLLIIGNLEMLASLNIDTTNLVNGKPIFYYTNELNLGPNNFTNAGQIILVNCRNSLISNLNVSNAVGITLYYCNYNIISGNIANNNNGAAIFLYRSDYNDISGNTANNNLAGIGLSRSHHNDISGNTANNNSWAGIYLIYSSNNNIVSGNIANNNGEARAGAGAGAGIYLYQSDYNDITENTANFNIEIGIYLE